MADYRASRQSRGASEREIITGLRPCQRALVLETWEGSGVTLMRPSLSIHARVTSARSSTPRDIIAHARNRLSHRRGRSIMCLRLAGVVAVVMTLVLAPVAHVPAQAPIQLKAGTAAGCFSICHRASAAGI